MSTIKSRRPQSGASTSAEPANAPAEHSPSPDPKLAWARALGLKIEYRKVGDLQSSRRNPRTHSKEQIHEIARSIREFGFISPLLVDRNGTIIVGRGRLDGAKLVGVD